MGQNVQKLNFSCTHLLSHSARFLNKWSLESIVQERNEKIKHNGVKFFRESWILGKAIYCYNWKKFFALWCCDWIKFRVDCTRKGWRNMHNWKNSSRIHQKFYRHPNLLSLSSRQYVIRILQELLSIKGDINKFCKNFARIPVICYCWLKKLCFVRRILI